MSFWKVILDLIDSTVSNASSNLRLAKYVLLWVILIELWRFPTFSVILMPPHFTHLPQGKTTPCMAWNGRSRQHQTWRILISSPMHGIHNFINFVVICAVECKKQKKKNARKKRSSHHPISKRCSCFFSFLRYQSKVHDTWKSNKKRKKVVWRQWIVQTVCCHCMMR